ncbi:MAG: imelysin family protein [Proteobacteria bacterium]|nr:imelysin family protein [Pseudomonadota bacterium]
MILRVCAALTLFAVLAGSQAWAHGSTEYEALNIALVDDVVMPGYAGHATATADFAEAMQGFCAGTRSGVEATVVAQYHAAMDAWQRIRPIAMGPILQGTGIARIEFWPDKRGTGARQIRLALQAEDPALLASAGLESKSVALGDLKALEYLFFPEDGGVAVPGSYRCSLAATIADRQAAIARELLVAWTGEDGFRTKIVTAARGNDAFFDAAEASADYLKNLAGLLDEIVVEKLERPLGKDLAQARPTRAESWRSRRSLRDIAANLETARALYATPGAFRNLLAAEGLEPLADGMLRQFDEAIAMAGGIGMPLHDAVADSVAREKLETLIELLRSLRVLVAGPLADRTGLTIGFNARDGD